LHDEPGFRSPRVVIDLAHHIERFPFDQTMTEGCRSRALGWRMPDSLMGQPRTALRARTSEVQFGPKMGI
jgi:hypothetical protein